MSAGSWLSAIKKLLVMTHFSRVIGTLRPKLSLSAERAPDQRERHDRHHADQRAPADQPAAADVGMAVCELTAWRILQPITKREARDTRKLAV